MKRKFLKLLVVIGFCVTMALGTTACNGKNKIDEAVEAIESVFIMQDVKVTGLNHGKITGLNQEGKQLSELRVPAKIGKITITDIESGAFKDCTNLTSVILSDGLRHIHSWAFKNCTNLTNITIPDSVIDISDYAFQGCGNLTNVYITDMEAWCKLWFGKNDANPLCYADNLYLNNELVTELIIPNTITEIKDYTFYSCGSLQSVVIHKGVTSIGEYAFRSCHGLTRVYYKGTERDWTKISIDSSNVSLIGAMKYYYSETQPTTDGNYWHYVDGVPTKWE